jgi:hypothetical protein
MNRLLLIARNAGVFPKRAFWLAGAALATTVCCAAFAGGGEVPHRAALLEAKAFPLQGPTQGLEPETLDYRFAPQYWQCCIGLPDDPYKTVVGCDGGLYYEYGGGKYRQFKSCVLAEVQAEGSLSPIFQSLGSGDGRAPIVVTRHGKGEISLHQDAWAGAPEQKDIAQWALRRVDFLWLKVRNNGAKKNDGGVAVQIDGKKLALNSERTRLVYADDPKKVYCGISPACDPLSACTDTSARLVFSRKGLAPGEEFRALLVLPQGPQAKTDFVEQNAAKEEQRAIAYWTGSGVGLPYNRIIVPDAAVQKLLDGCIRNIYQAREINSGKPAFQVGPTCYRGTWAADGAFLLETAAYLGRASEARAGLENQADGDTGPGGVTFSKQMGLRIWTIWRHAQLTGDMQWLAHMWPRVERNMNQIIAWRKSTKSDPKAVNFGLMPPGYADGGLSEIRREYSNVYWTLAGEKAAIEAAEKLGQPVAADWKAEYQDYWNCFDKARNRDKLTDAAGNVYVPITMTGEPKYPPQCAAWAFMQSVFPGRVFDRADPLMCGTLAMLDASQREGLVYGTGWLRNGIWNYAGSFYAHAHLWQGHGSKAAATLYAFGNHACPLLCWREEQNCKSEQYNECGDMPHNWASAEFVRLVRHLLVLERGNELHLLQGLPQSWTKPGKQTRLIDMPTSFGNIALTVTVAGDGRSARLLVDPPRREPLEKIVVHLEHFGRPISGVRLDGQPLGDKTSEVPTDKRFTLDVAFGQ